MPSPRTITVLVLQPDAEMYGACSALFRALRSEPARSTVRPIVIFPYDGPAVEVYRAAGARVRVEPLAVVRRPTFTIRGVARLVVEFVRSSIRVSRIARREGVTLIHANSMAVMTGVGASLLARTHHVWQLRECPTDRRVLRVVFRLLALGRRTTLIAVSPASAMLAGRKRCAIVSDGVSMPPARRPDALVKGHVVACIGRIGPGKGQDIVVEAWRQTAAARPPDWALWLVGTTYSGNEPFTRDLVSAIERGGGDGSIATLGFVEDIDSVYRSADIVVVATRTGEGLCLVALEALSHGVPVVSATHGGIEDVVDEHTGIVTPVGDPVAMGAGLVHLMEDASLRECLGREGRVRAATWSVERSARELVAIWGTRSR